MLKSVGLKSAGIRMRENLLYAGKERAADDQIIRVRAILKDEYDYWSKTDPRTLSLWGYK
jgi:hypothetical protein